ncbi:hypothetical protein AALP_AA5G042000 [Arabis alpina]|uniref:FBD domain-containing protein n=1 Tax=Arabis alpina TaxID=50452 RepID=A0A087GUV2_ARAAL|nr:hypothetical protein AALP_AA5G042000 [Arabis alpina]
MPKLEEADIYVEDGVDDFLRSITSVKRLSISSDFDSGNEFSISFEYLKMYSQPPKLLFGLLEDSPKLGDLYIYDYSDQHGYAPFSLNNISVPKCLLDNLESFKFKGYKATPVQREFLSFFFRNASRLKSSQSPHGRN